MSGKKIMTRKNLPELYILRHGQTEWNAVGRMQGHLDSPLTNLGQEQARTQLRILKAQNLPADTTFHCSPLGRARQTAALALAGLTKRPCFDDRLKEISVGKFEGLTMYDLDTCWPEIMRASSPYSWHYRAPGGERFVDFRARIKDWLDEQTTTAVVVTHGMTSGVLRGLALGLDVDGIAKLPGGQGVIYHIKDGAQHRLDAQSIKT